MTHIYLMEIREDGDDQFEVEAVFTTMKGAIQGLPTRHDLVIQYEEHDVAKYTVTGSDYMIYITKMRLQK